MTLLEVKPQLVQKTEWQNDKTLIDWWFVLNLIGTTQFNLLNGENAQKMLFNTQM